MRDLKYLAAYLLPLSAVVSLAAPGPWRWATVVLTFGIIPLLELFTRESDANIDPAEEESRVQNRFFDVLLHLNVPIVFMAVLAYLQVITTETLTTAAFVGLSFSIGIVLGANGINVAHELGHRQRWVDQFLAKLLLLPALYQHFFIEHNRGHHKHVGTPEDAATSRLNESLYSFWLRSVAMGWLGAWKQERRRLEHEGKPFFSWHNEMLQFQVAQLTYLLLVWVVFGGTGVLGAVIIAGVAFLLLESINYIEHYGLMRQQMASGRYEPVNATHSWNSDHELGRIFLYELTRHSDHHYKASRKYQVLRHLQESPQLPYGYPTSVMLAVVPPLWFRVMNPKVQQVQQGRGAVVA
jgi:alkane 1-monooxygenase